MTGNLKFLLKCGFVEHQGHKVVYRRYASLFFIVGIDESEVRLPPCPSQRLTLLPQNELAMYEFIHNVVEIFDLYFHQVVTSFRHSKQSKYSFTQGSSFSTK